MHDLVMHHGGRQVAASSKDADAQGAGRGETWPEGVVDALTWFRDFGARVVDANLTADFDIAAGLDQLEDQFGASVGAVLTTNGTANFLFCAGSRGPFPSVKAYAKAHNAWVRNWPIYTGVARLMDAPQINAAGGSQFELLGDKAKVILWDSVDEAIARTTF